MVREAAIDQMTIVGVMVHGHELDGGHAELFEVTQRRWADQPGIGAAQGINLRVPLGGSSAHLVMIVSCHGCAAARRFPRERCIGSRRDGANGAIAIVEREVLVGCPTW